MSIAEVQQRTSEIARGCVSSAAPVPPAACRSTPRDRRGGPASRSVRDEPSPPSSPRGSTSAGGAASRSSARHQPPAPSAARRPPRAVTGEDVVAKAKSSSARRTSGAASRPAASTAPGSCSGPTSSSASTCRASPRDQAKVGRAVTPAEAQPGDLVFFDRPGRPHRDVRRQRPVGRRPQDRRRREGAVRRPVEGHHDPPGAARAGRARRGRPPRAGRAACPRCRPPAGASPTRSAPRRRKAGIDPRLLAAVAWSESGFDPSARSPAGAVGLMQLMPRTAAGLGVDPTDPPQALSGGASYLSQQLTAFGAPRPGARRVQRRPRRRPQARRRPALRGDAEVRRRPSSPATPPSEARHDQRPALPLLPRCPSTRLATSPLGAACPVGRWQEADELRFERLGCPVGESRRTPTARPPHGPGERAEPRVDGGRPARPAAPVRGPGGPSAPRRLAGHGPDAPTADDAVAPLTPSTRPSTRARPTTLRRPSPRRTYRLRRG